MPQTSHIVIKLKIGETSVDLLYDPGSTYTTLTREACDSLKSKPPLTPIAKSGVTVSGEKFQIDGVAFVNIKFEREDSSQYLLEYQPVLVSRNVSSNLFGMHTDLQFKGVLRNNEDESITFLPQNDREVKIKYFKENRGNKSALVHVAKVTIIFDKSVRLIHSKITNGSINKLVQPPFTLTLFRK